MFVFLQLSEPDTFDKYKNCEEQTDFGGFKKRAQSLFIVVPTAPTENYENFTNQVREYNTKDPFNFHTSEYLNIFEKVNFPFFLIEFKDAKQLFQYF